MKKLDSSHDKETPQEELKRLRKENKILASQKDKFKAKYDKAQNELKKTLLERLDYPLKENLEGFKEQFQRLNNGLIKYRDYILYFLENPLKSTIDVHY